MTVSTGQRQPSAARLAEVASTERLTPGMTRVTFTGPGLAGFRVGQFTDHYVKLQLPPPEASYRAPFDMEEIRAQLPRVQWPRTRTYTVADWDADRQQLTIDFVIHGENGVAGPWAVAAQPGDRVQLAGPGGAYAPDPQADWHLMVGDASVLPAISASLNRIPEGIPVRVVVEVDGPQEQRELRTPGDLHVTWVNQVATDQSHEALSRAVSQLALPSGRGQCFVHGEAAAVRALRRHLLLDRGLPRDMLSISGYWKRDRTEDGWREDKAAWNNLVEQDLERGAPQARGTSS